MKKNLVYYSVGINPIYSKMLLLSIKSMEKTNKKRPDVLIITDKKFYEQNFKNLEINNIFFHFVENYDDPNQVCFDRLKIFDFEKIQDYGKLLYLDVDTIINCDLNKLFNNLVKNKLNVVVEDYNLVNHKRIHFSLGNYTDEDLSFFEENEIHTFNSGTFLFENTILMRRHFKNVLEIIKEHKGDFFTDQSFINYYFNTYSISDFSVLKKNKNYLFLVDENFDSEFDLDDKILHFIGNTFISGDVKYKKMKMIYEKLHSVQEYKERIFLFDDLNNIIGKNGCGVEIGVFKGELSNYILNKWDGVLYMVDVWRELGEEYSDSSNIKFHSDAYAETMNNIKGFENRAIMIRSTSKDAIKLFQDQSLDFVYIDANHAYDFVKEDLELWFPKLKKGGMFSGHDYLGFDWYNDPYFAPNGKDKYIYINQDDGTSIYNGLFGVNPAVDEFCEKYGYTLNKTKEWFGTWWFIK